MEDWDGVRSRDDDFRSPQRIAESRRIEYVLLEEHANNLVRARSWGDIEEERIISYLTSDPTSALNSSLSFVYSMF